MALHIMVRCFKRMCSAQVKYIEHKIQIICGLALSDKVMIMENEAFSGDEGITIYCKACIINQSIAGPGSSVGRVLLDSVW